MSASTVAVPHPSKLPPEPGLSIPALDPLPEIEAYPVAVVFDDDGIRCAEPFSSRRLAEVFASIHTLGGEPSTVRAR